MNLRRAAARERTFRNSRHLLTNKTTSIVQRRFPRPAFERSVKGAHFRVAQKKGDLCERVVGVFQIIKREAPARIVDQGSKIAAATVQVSLQGARAPRQRLGDSSEVEVAVLYSLGDFAANQREPLILFGHVAE
jgi:hypothetical protein